MSGGHGLSIPQIQIRKIGIFQAEFLGCQSIILINAVVFLTLSTSARHVAVVFNLGIGRFGLIFLIFTRLVGLTWNLPQDFHPPFLEQHGRLSYGTIQGLLIFCLPLFFPACQTNPLYLRPD